MRETNPKVDDEVERYLRTGDTDIKHAAWSGAFMARANQAHDDLRGALLRRVHQLAAGRLHHPVADCDTNALIRSRVEPVVRGLFPLAEQDVILAALEKSVVFLTSTNIDSILLKMGFHRAAWDIANLYLGSVTAELLGEGASRAAAGRHTLRMNRQTSRVGENRFEKRRGTACVGRRVRPIRASSGRAC